MKRITVENRGKLNFYDQDLQVLFIYYDLEPRFITTQIAYSVPKKFFERKKNQIKLKRRIQKSDLFMFYLTSLPERN